MSKRQGRGVRLCGWRAATPVLIALTACAAARAAAPTLGSIAPNETSVVSGGPITATGSDFEAGAVVYIRLAGGSTWRACFTLFLSSEMLRFSPPTDEPGLFDVRVENPGGETADLLGALTVLPVTRIDSVMPSFGTVAGGTQITITGRGFDTSVSCEADMCDTREPLVGQAVNADETVITGAAPAYPSALPLGNVAGFPETLGEHDFTVSATDGVASDELTFRVCVSEIVVLPVSAPAAVLDAPYSQPFQGQGGAPSYTWSVTGALPGGMVLTSTGATTCEISGTPTETGTFPVVLSLFDSTSPTPLTGSRELDIVVYPNTSVTVVTDTLPSGKVGVYHEAQLEAGGGAGPYSWTLASGALPDGLSLSPGGLISGTPTAVGAPFTFSVDMSDSTMPTALTANKALGITITLASEVDFDTSALRHDSVDDVWLLPDAIVGEPYEHMLEGMGGLGVYLYTPTSATMPDGLHLNAEIVPVRVDAVVLGQPVSDTAFLFVYVPKSGDVTGVTLDTGPSAGGTLVTVTGTGFADGARVFFGAGEATGVSWSNATTLTCLTPENPEEVTVGVRVLNPDGSASEGFDLYTYRQPPILVLEEGGCVAGTGGGCAGMLLCLGLAALVGSRRRRRRRRVRPATRRDGVCGSDRSLSGRA